MDRHHLEDFIKALRIIQQYLPDGGVSRFSGCSHDVFWIPAPGPGWAESLTPEHVESLESYGFEIDVNGEFAGALISERFGSC